VWVTYPVWVPVFPFIEWRDWELYCIFFSAHMNGVQRRQDEKEKAEQHSWGVKGLSKGPLILCFNLFALLWHYFSLLPELPIQLAVHINGESREELSAHWGSFLHCYLSLSSPWLVQVGASEGQDFNRDLYFMSTVALTVCGHCFTYHESSPNG
jgi:hypothetical protein